MASFSVHNRCSICSEMANREGRGVGGAAVVTHSPFKENREQLDVCPQAMSTFYDDMIRV